MSARDEVLLRGLIDWVALERVHSRVARENAGEPLAVIQEKVLDLIRSLVTDGLFDLATPNHRFGAWDGPLDESIQRIRDVYVNQFDDDPEWWFYCWLKLTEKGRKLAEAIEASRESAQPGPGAHRETLCSLGRAPKACLERPSHDRALCP
jgi:hypothetical protein